jgi:anti-sigma B factor antagonist
LLEIKERKGRGITILDLEGNLILGGSSNMLSSTIKGLVEKGRKKLLLNFAGVNYMDSSGIGELISIHVTIDRASGQLKLVNLSSKVEEVMAICSLLSIFEIYDDESTALKEYD